jgi:flagellar basal-body rod protein FlgB
MRQKFPFWPAGAGGISQGRLGKFLFHLFKGFKEGMLSLGICSAQYVGMITPVGNNANYVLAQRLLDMATLRQEAIAGNIANSETPGYRRHDVSAEFRDALRAQFAGGATPDLSTLSQIRPQLAPDVAARSVRPDGNSVDLEHELMEMSRNRVEHEFLAEYIGGHIKQLRMAITGRTV